MRSQLAKTPASLILGLVLWGLALGAWGETWQGQLQGGGQVQVDPVTRKPVLQHEGGEVPLWDGVHQLDSGSVVIVRQGVAVPSEGMYGTWNGQQAPEPEDELVPVCERLVRKTCGFHEECFQSSGCNLALQVRRMEQEEAGHGPQGQLTGAAQGCRQGLADPALFPTCDQLAEGKATPCQKLEIQSCGVGGGCKNAGACVSARQLVELERNERLQRQDPNGLTDTGRQCQEAAGNDYFILCGQ